MECILPVADHPRFVRVTHLLAEGVTRLIDLQINQRILRVNLYHLRHGLNRLLNGAGSRCCLVRFVGTGVLSRVLRVGCQRGRVGQLSAGLLEQVLKVQARDRVARG